MKGPRLVLVGAGARGRTWAHVVSRSKSCELAAFVDTDPNAIRGMAESFDALPGFRSLELALEEVDDVDAVILATPPFGRAEQVGLVTEHRLPVLVEKPLAASLQEAMALVDAAERTGTPMMVGLNFRYLASTQRLRQLCLEGVLGAPESARFTYERFRDGHEARLNKYPLTMRDPMLWEQSVHHFDLMRYVYDAEPTLVYCRSWNPAWSMYVGDANVTAVIELSNGMVVSYLGTWQGSWGEMNFEWRTDFSEGIAIQRDQFGELAIAHGTNGVLAPVELPPHERWFSDAAVLLEHFIAGVVDGTWQECTARDHMTSLAIVEACIRSNAERSPVLVQDVLADSIGGRP